jgi:TRAP-type C4-dicarboxylate transport system substrate-binding protein
MKRRFPKPVLICFMSVTLLLCLTASGMTADKIELRFASEYPDKHPTSANAFMPWIKKVDELSKGGLMIQFFNPNTICPAREAYASTVAGSVDIAASPVHYVFGKFPLSEVIQLPFLFNGAEAGSLTTWEVYNRFPEWREEYRELRVLWQWTSALLELHTVKKPVRTLEDLRGLKIISWSAHVNAMLRALGANPVDSKPMDTYMALERGMADGVICPIAPMRAFKISDAAKHHTILNLGVDVFWAGANPGKWNNLPQDLRKILEETTGDKMAQLSGKTLDEGSIKDVQWMKEQKHTFYVLPQKEKERWREKVRPISEEWVKKMEGKGYKIAQKLHETVTTLGRENSEKTPGGYRD